MVDLASGLAGHASATALIEGGRRVSYAELSDLVMRTAAGLRGLGLTTGARVLVVVDPSTDGVVSYLGVQAAGLVPVMVGPQSPLAEVSRRVTEVDPACVLLGCLPGAELPDGLRVVRPAGSTETDAPALDGEPIEPARVSSTDPAVVLYTSGVSGLPKPVVLTYGNLAATRDGLVAGAGSGLDSSTVAYAGLPLAHVFGLNSIIGTVLSVGGKLVLHRRFVAAEVAELAARHRITAISAVPLMWKQLAAIGDRELFASVTRPTYAAAPLPPTVAAAVKDALGLTVVGGFGLTETAGTICHDDPTNPHPGSVGLALGDTLLRVVENGVDAVPGDFGEIWVSGPSVAQAYLDGSPLDLTPDGWLRTGDVGVLDEEGHLSIVDRKKDVINVSGFNVSPLEVEQALAEHPLVAASAVVGEVEDDHEIVVAHTVLIPGATTSEQDLVDHCRNLLSRYKVPRRIYIDESLPVTESGKAVRRLLGRAS